MCSNFRREKPAGTSKSQSPAGATDQSWADRGSDGPIMPPRGFAFAASTSPSNSTVMAHLKAIAAKSRRHARGKSDARNCLPHEAMKETTATGRITWMSARFNTRRMSRALLEKDSSYLLQKVSGWPARILGLRGNGLTDVAIPPLFDQSVSRRRDKAWGARIPDRAISRGEMSA